MMKSSIQRSKSLVAGMVMLGLILVLTFSLSFAAAPGGGVIINEIDYDQPGSDSAEFIELINTSGITVNLDVLSVELINGSGGGAALYNTIDLPNVDLGPGDYYVICANPATVANCDLDVSPDTNLVQNGAPDAVGLKASTTLIDSVSYEGDTGTPYTEGSGSGLIDDPALADKGISRCPDGTDTNQNNADLSYQDITPGAENDCSGSGGFGICGDPATLIHDIQGSGLTSPEEGNTHVVEAIVVGDFQDTTTGLSGFFLQEEDGEADADSQTSEGLFIFDNGFGVEVSPGDIVRAQGTVVEFFSQTELSAVSNVAVCSSGSSVTPSPIALPVASVDAWESTEGMLVFIDETLYVGDTFNLGTFGEVGLSVSGRLDQPTNVVAPGAPALALQDLNDRSRIQLDDGSDVSGPAPLPPYLLPDGTLRAGDTLPGLTGTLGYSFGEYEVHPVDVITFTRVNTRTAGAPVVSGTLTAASFNVLNYFTTIDTGAPICGPSGNLDCRGADTPAELIRQRDKLVSALAALDADIVGLIEIENNVSTSTQDLVDGLNAAVGAGTYDLINTGTIGSDAIKVAFIYKPGTVTPMGAFAILDSAVDPLFNSDKNRPALAQTFEESATAERLTVVVNHLKSKGSACNDVGDPDLGDGQGNCNVTRTNAATALGNWLATDPTNSGDPDFLIIGDLNAYAQEDPIAALQTASYTDLVDTYQGLGAYSYVFFGQAGYLDHALSSASLTSQIAGAAFWHINADEPRALDYNDFNQPGLYLADPYRSSDHDPVVVGLNLGSPVFLFEQYLPAVQHQYQP